MTTAIVPHRRVMRQRQTTPEDVIRTWLDRRSQHTARAYRADLSVFADWLGVLGPAEAVKALMDAGQGEANLLVMDFKAALRRVGLAASTINRRLAAIKSVLKLARLIGLTQVTIEVERERQQQYRDTRGPGLQRVREILRDLEKVAVQDGVAIRNLAICRLLFNNGLRCHEVVGLDMEHVHLSAGEISILGKGRTEREAVSLSPKAAEALATWLRLRGDAPGPVFVSMHGRSRKPRPGGHRIDRRHIYAFLVGTYGVRPHGLRHAAITTALEATDGNMAAVMRFSRHLNPNVLMVYEDNRQNAAAKIAKKLDVLA